MTPTGFALLVVVVLVVGPAATVFFLGAVVRLIAGAVSTVSKTRGLEWPVAERVPSLGILGVLVFVYIGGKRVLLGRKVLATMIDQGVNDMIRNERDDVQ